MKILIVQASKPFLFGFTLAAVAFVLLNLYSLHQNSTGGLEGVLGIIQYYDGTVRWGYPFQVRDAGGIEGRDEMDHCALLLNLLVVLGCGYVGGSIFDTVSKKPGNGNG